MTDFRATAVCTGLEGTPVETDAAPMLSGYGQVIQLLRSKLRHETQRPCREQHWYFPRRKLSWYVARIWAPSGWPEALRVVNL